MGWTHYWKREIELPAANFGEAVADCRKVLSLLDVPLAGADGNGSPVLNENRIAFNGASETACEPFEIDRIQQPKFGKNAVFEHCKTEHRPYDIAVQCCLIIFKHYLGSFISIRSDGKENNWDNAKSIIADKLGIETENILQTEQGWLN